MNKNCIGFIYRIDYTGDNQLIKNLSYAGSKKLTSKIKWEKYFGSPSKKNCIKCIEWKKESKLHPEKFDKKIIKYVYSDESLIQNEINYLKIISPDIIADDKWLNYSIPKVGAFPEYVFSQEDMKAREALRKRTILNRTGNEHGYFIDIDKRRKTCIERYNTDHYNKTEQAKLKNSNHKKKYFESMNEEERKNHGIKSLLGRNPENVSKGSIKSTQTRKNLTPERKAEIENKRRENWYKSIYNRSEEKMKYISKINSEKSKKNQKRLYVTIKHIETGVVESDFITNWIERGYARDGIRNRIKNNSQKVLFSRVCKKKIIVLSHSYIKVEDLNRVD